MIGELGMPVPVENLLMSESCMPGTIGGDRPFATRQLRSSMKVDQNVYIVKHGAGLRAVDMNVHSPLE